MQMPDNRSFPAWMLQILCKLQPCKQKMHRDLRSTKENVGQHPLYDPVYIILRRGRDYGYIIVQIDSIPRCNYDRRSLPKCNFIDHRTSFRGRSRIPEYRPNGGKKRRKLCRIRIRGKFMRRLLERLFLKGASVFITAPDVLIKMKRKTQTVDTFIRNSRVNSNYPIRSIRRWWSLLTRRDLVFLGGGIFR